jgi:hypothetical protein
MTSPLSETAATFRRMAASWRALGREDEAKGCEESADKLDAALAAHVALPSCPATHEGMACVLRAGHGPSGVHLAKGGDVWREPKPQRAKRAG